MCNVVHSILHLCRKIPPRRWSWMAWSRSSEIPWPQRCEYAVPNMMAMVDAIDGRYSALPCSALRSSGRQSPNRRIWIAVFQTCVCVCVAGRAGQGRAGQGRAVATVCSGPGLETAPTACIGGSSTIGWWGGDRSICSAIALQRSVLASSGLIVFRFYRRRRRQIDSPASATAVLRAARREGLRSSSASVTVRP